MLTQRFLYGTFDMVRTIMLQFFGPVCVEVGVNWCLHTIKLISRIVPGPWSAFVVTNRLFFLPTDWLLGTKLPQTNCSPATGDPEHHCSCESEAGAEVSALLWEIQHCGVWLDHAWMSADKWRHGGWSCCLCLQLHGLLFNKHSSWIWKTLGQASPVVVMWSYSSVSFCALIA